MTNSRRKHRRYRQVFIDANGEGPWLCYSCNGVVERIGRSRYDGNIHHLDEDVTNDVIHNLVMMHVICHQHLHPITPELRQQISEKLKGRPSPTRGMKFSKEVNEKKSHPGELNPFFGKHHSQNSLKKMRQPRQRIHCQLCNKNWAVNWIKRHEREGLCVS